MILLQCDFSDRCPWVYPNIPELGKEVWVETPVNKRSGINSLRYSIGKAHCLTQPRCERYYWTQDDWKKAAMLKLVMRD